MKKRYSLAILVFLSLSLHSQEKKEDFDNFLFKFASDSIFQINRIKFPLEYVTWKSPTEIGGEVIKKFIKIEEWKHNYFFFNKPYRPQIFDNFEGRMRDTDERLFQWIGIENGINSKYFFKCIKMKWYLIKTENLGD